MTQPNTKDLIQREDDKNREFVVRKQSRSTMGFVPGTLDEENRSVEVVAATETPSQVWDPSRWEVVTEVLLMSGCRIPKGRDIPLTIEHFNRVDAAIGSLREMRIDGEQLIGRVYFSSSADAEPYWIKVKEGHLKRFSIVYPASDRNSTYIAENQTAEIEGKTYKGPMVVTKRWTPKALGLVLFGADKNAKARQAKPIQTKEKDNMDPKLRAFLERSGLSKDATEAEAWAFLERLELPPTNPPAQPAAPAAPAQPADPPVDEAALRAEAAATEQQRVVEINAMCRRFGCEDMADGLISGNVSIDKARKQVLDHLAENADQNNPGHMPPATIQADERDKFRNAAVDSLLIRSGLVVVESPAPGAQDLTGYSLKELARHALQVANLPTGGNPLEMVGRAMTTSDFPLLLANVANKHLMAGWDEADETWQVWCGVGSVSDFKTHSALRASETDDLDEIPEKVPYKYGERSEAQEQYSVVTYGKLFALSRQTIINDDLNALADTPRAHGESAKRKTGDVVYAVLTANAAMGDGTALFHANHSNLSSGAAGAPSETTIGPAVAAMKKQKDIKGKRRLNIRPVYFLAPVALESSSEIFFNSEMYTGSDAKSTRKNIYGGSVFQRVYEPRLDDDSATAWYLLAKKGKTVKVFFLNGVQKPYLETKQGWTVDGVEYKVRIDCGAKAMDWRGMNKNAGA